MKGDIMEKQKEWFDISNDSDINEWKEKYKDLIEQGRKKALKICHDYQKMANDLGEFDSDLVVSEQEYYLKQNEKRYSDWLYLNIK